MRFSGTIGAKLDAKGRVFLPSAFRKVLSAAQEETLFLRKDDYEKCLTLLPASVWNARLDALRESLRGQGPGVAASIFRQYVKDTEEVTLDGNGRFLVSRSFLLHAEIEQTVSFVGMDGAIELWNPENLDDSMMPAADYRAALDSLGTALIF